MIRERSTWTTFSLWISRAARAESARRCYSPCSKCRLPQMVMAPITKPRTLNLTELLEALLRVSAFSDAEA